MNRVKLNARSKISFTLGMATLLLTNVVAADELLFPYLVTSQTVTSMQHALSGELERLGVLAPKDQLYDAAKDCTAKLRAESEANSGSKKTVRCGSGDLMFRIPIQ
jgi:hypothetical protein